MRKAGRHTRRAIVALAVTAFASHCVVGATSTAAGGGSAADASAHRALIVEMKQAPRGPFKRLRWFCNDGSVLPPKAYACQEHGSGHQHGEWSDATLTLHAAGYPIANVMVELSAEQFDASEAANAHFRILLLEQFLIRIDDGWILRRGRYYRGAFQVDEEEYEARQLLRALSSRPAWQTLRYPLLVEAARLIAHGQQRSGAAEIRNMATALNRADPGFGDLRNKIHGRPDPGDADRVRSYAKQRGLAELAADYTALADAIDAAAALPDAAPLVAGYAKSLTNADQQRALMVGATKLQRATTPSERLAALGELMQQLRDGIKGAAQPLRAIDLILALEAHVFNEAQLIDLADSSLNRRQSLVLMENLAKAAYGLGLLTRWELDNAHASFEMLAGASVAFSRYRSELRYLERVSGWGARRLALYFEPEIAHLAQIEPLVVEYIPDRMRGSPLFFYSQLIAPLAADAMRMAGLRQELFGRAVPAGLRALNPGVGRGVLRTLEQLEHAPEGSANSIALVPETVSELPVVAGILTEHEGNALSHVQLLARNLGVPNIVVSDALLPELRKHLGEQVAVASSPGGVVRISSDAAALESAAPVQRELISIDVSRLDLDTQQLIPAAQLSSADQGVRVGPKAAQVGRLTRHFPGQVAPALAVPFGLFSHALTERTVEPGGPTLFEWMAEHFRELQNIDDPVERATRTRETLAVVRGWFETRPPNPVKLEEFRRSLEENFGPSGSYGVFVRSDTNVEDLPGFTGAGINLTVPNVVGFENIVAAMRAVWASPFTERSYGWRQGIMDDPEHVYASVLLHKSMNLDTSGVLVTVNVETGATDYLTVVLNEGVGGGVEGQAAETLLIRTSDASLRLLGSATAPRKRVLLERGGSELIPTSGAERLLSPANVDDLRNLVAQLPDWFDYLPPAERAAAVADVEFGFLDDKLYLFQIRPFVQSSAADDNAYLRELDAGLDQTREFQVNMNDTPGG